MKSFGVLFAMLVCFASVNLAKACPLATTSVVESCDAVQPAQPVVAVQALAVPSVAVVAQLQSCRLRRWWQRRLLRRRWS